MNDLASTRETDVMECCSYLRSVSYLSKCSLGYSEQVLGVIAQFIAYPFAAVFAVPLDPVTNPEPKPSKDMTPNVKRSWHQKMPRKVVLTLYSSDSEGYMTKLVNATSDKFGQLHDLIMHSRVFRVSERVVSVFIRLCIVYYCLECICYWFLITFTVFDLFDFFFIDFYVYFYINYSMHIILYIIFSS